MVDSERLVAITEKMMACLKGTATYLEAMEACLEKIEATMKARKS
jgi:hypothetical protein